MYLKDDASELIVALGHVNVDGIEHRVVAKRHCEMQGSTRIKQACVQSGAPQAGFKQKAIVTSSPHRASTFGDCHIVTTPCFHVLLLYRCRETAATVMLKH